MTDLFDRPVVWGLTSTVADDATEAATGESGVIPRNSDAKRKGVAPVASVARADAEAGSAISAKVTAARRRAHGVAGVATVAETDGERLERLLSQSSVATRATDRATDRAEDFRGLHPHFEAAVAGVAPVAIWQSQVHGMGRVSPAPQPYHTPWRVLYSDMLGFMGIWADDAARLGWSTLDVFGVNPDPAHARYDRLGLLILLNGRPIQSLDEDCAYIGKDQQPTVFRRALRAPGAVPVWQWLESVPQ